MLGTEVGYLIQPVLEGDVMLGVGRGEGGGGASLGKRGGGASMGR